MCGGWGATYELLAKLHAIINLKTYTIIQVKDQCAKGTRLPAVPLMSIGYIQNEIIPQNQSSILSIILLVLWNSYFYTSILSWKGNSRFFFFCPPFCVIFLNGLKYPIYSYILCGLVLQKRKRIEGIKLWLISISL